MVAASVPWARSRRGGTLQHVLQDHAGQVLAGRSESAGELRHAGTLPQKHLDGKPYCACDTPAGAGILRAGRGPRQAALDPVLTLDGLYVDAFEGGTPGPGAWAGRWALRRQGCRRQGRRSGDLDLAPVAVILARPVPDRGEVAVMHCIGERLILEAEA